MSWRTASNVSLSSHILCILKSKKMIPLSVHKQMWTVICVCPFDENTSYFKRFICYVFLLTVFVLNVGLVFSSLAFVMEFWSSDLEGSLHATFQFSAHISVVYLIIVQIVSRQEIASVFHRLSKIYDKCEHSLNWFYLCHIWNVFIYIYHLIQHF